MRRHAASRLQRLRGMTARTATRRFVALVSLVAAVLTLVGTLLRLAAACVAYAGGAWCRDLVERPNAGGCAYGAHVHGPDEACNLG